MRERRKREEMSDMELRQRELKLSINPYIHPCGTAKAYDSKIQSHDDYDQLTRKVNQRSAFILAKIPYVVASMVANRMFGYWTGSKLSKVNPHKVWDPETFTPGTPNLDTALHLVVACSKGDEAYRKAYLGLPLTHTVIGLPKVGCAGTFLGTDSIIDQYLANDSLSHAVRADMEMPIDRIWKDERVIEFLTHSVEDVRDNTLFLIFDDESGKTTRKFRKRFPMHQMVTVVRGMEHIQHDLGSMFFRTESLLKGKKLICGKKEYKDKGFYTGQTVFVSDFLSYYEEMNFLQKEVSIFGTIALFSTIGPNYSGIIWGSKGGAEGAIKAARTMYGLKGGGASSPEHIAAAINWADGVLRLCEDDR
ncbi:MAG: hypothetical protein ACI9S8_002915 [Chlamydiales bacterium]